MDMSRRTFTALAGSAAAVAASGGIGAATADEAQPEIKAGTFTPGTYFGDADGRNGHIKVVCAFSEDRLLSVFVQEQSDSPRLSDAAFSELPREIVKYQALDVDTPTGCTFSSLGMISAISQCVEQAGGTEALAAMQARTGAPKLDEVVDLEADAVVVGAGIAGMVAAVALAQGGKSVVVLEKTSAIGGNCLVSLGLMSRSDTPPESVAARITPEIVDIFNSMMTTGRELGYPEDWMQSIQDQWDEFYSDPEETRVFLSEDLLALSFNIALLYPAELIPVQLDFVKVVTSEQKWFEKNGYPFGYNIGAVGYPWPGLCQSVFGPRGQSFFKFFDEVLAREDLDIQILTSTPATELIMDGDAVVGAVGQCDDGRTFRVHAPHTILATGGCASNAEMVKELDDYWGDALKDYSYLRTNMTSGTDGSGLLLGQSAGGSLVRGQEQLLPMVSPVTGSIDGIVGDDSNAFIVGAHGRRIANELADRSTLTAAFMAEPDDLAFMISDAKNCMIDKYGMAKEGANTEFLIERGRLFKADTLEDLADQAGIDKEAFLATVEHMNAMAAGEETDDEFGRVKFTNSDGVSCSIDTPPFYAWPCTWACHISFGGLDHGDGWHVLNEAGEPIEGLYVVGDTALNFGGMDASGSSVQLAEGILGA